MNNRPSAFSALAAMICLLLAAPAHADDWAVTDRDNPDMPGRRVDATHSGQPVASFIYGEGQMKTYLHVYGKDDELLTNPGLDADGEEAGLFPHHRGIFIGWNQIESDLGSDDLWHMRNGERIELTRLDKIHAADDSAEIVATLNWRSASGDADHNLLLTERREMLITRPAEHRTQIDARFTLTAARDLKLNGDLQHAGIHFRAANEVADRADETAYIWQPDLDGGEGRIVNPDDLQWVRFLFPIGDEWYTALQLNDPDNPVEELSWRDYGRFGYFFKREMAAGDELTVNYRFIVEHADAPDRALDRSDADDHYQAYIHDVAD